MQAAELVAQVSEVCPLPATVQRVIALTSDDRPRIQAVTEAVAADPALATEVLRLANSAAYGRVRQVDDLADGIVAIGLDEVRCVATGMAMLAAFHSDHELALDLHKSSLMCASVGRTVADIWGAAHSAAFLAGLLSDIGMLACLAVDADDYCELVVAADNDLASQAQLEVERYGATSREIGAGLLLRNGLPTEVTEAVGASDVEEDSDSPLTRATRFARRVTAVLMAAAHSGDQEELVRDLQAIVERDVEEPRRAGLVALCVTAANASHLHGERAQGH